MIEIYKANFCDATVRQIFFSFKLSQSKHNQLCTIQALVRVKLLWRHCLAGTKFVYKGGIKVKAGTPYTIHHTLVSPNKIDITLVSIKHKISNKLTIRLASLWIEYLWNAQRFARARQALTSWFNLFVVIQYVQLPIYSRLDLSKKN